MTPRQLAGYFHLTKKRTRLEQAEHFAHMAIAFRGDGKELQKSINLILEDSE